MSRRKHSQKGAGSFAANMPCRPVQHALARLIAALALLLSLTTRAGDWPQFRRPNRDGVWNETCILQIFSPDGLKIRRRATVGAGHSSPFVAGGRVFVTDSEVEKPKAWERVHCFDEPHVHAYDPRRACVRRQNRRPLRLLGCAHGQTSLEDRQSDPSGAWRDDP